MFEVPLEVKVWGDFACFTRPEMKVERVSYPVMTPSAARGVLEAIFWKPEFQWRVREIVVLRPIRYFSILRNEVNSRTSERSAKDWSKNGGGYSPTDPDQRSQRHTLALRDVGYIIRADAAPTSGLSSDASKYRDQFRRRVVRGQCFAQPYLGCREFSAFFAPVSGTENVESITADLGRMLLNLEYSSDSMGSAVPTFFTAQLNNGLLRIPREGVSNADAGVNS